ncbi:MAG: holin [Clostridia bacterium]|nr:holin [Clostridia bacterium]
MKNILSRFRSWALWLSLAALIVFCVKEFCGVDISLKADAFMNVLLPVLVAFGIVNNPTDKKNI